MFRETSYENLFITEHWPASISKIKGNFSKKMKSLSNLSSCSTLSSLSASCSNSYINLQNSNNIMETVNKLYLFNSQRSLLYIIEEKEEKLREK